jgi:hypothetical protein
MILVLSIEPADLIEVPITDCGGLVDDHGGVITKYITCHLQTQQDFM